MDAEDYARVVLTLDVDTLADVLAAHLDHDNNVAVVALLDDLVAMSPSDGGNTDDDI